MVSTGPSYFMCWKWNVWSFSRSNSWVSVAIYTSRDFFPNSHCLFQVLIIRRSVRVGIIWMLMQISRGIRSQQGNSSLYPVGIDPDAYCGYYSGAPSHLIEDCKIFIDKVQDLLDSKASVFTPDSQNWRLLWFSKHPDCWKSSESTSPFGFKSPLQWHFYRCFTAFSFVSCLFV